MGLFSKKQSDEEYVRLKNGTINDYNKLIVKNPFAPAEELRDKWQNMYQQIKQVYKLSKKYFDTEADIPVLKAYRDDALNRSNGYAHEIEYLAYKEEFENVEKTYKELEDEKSNLMSSFGDEYQIFQIFESLYERVCYLKQNYYKYSNDNIDENKLEEMYKGISYYYCGFMLNNLFYKTSDGRILKWEFRKECLDKCKKVAGRFNEEKFKVISGIADYEYGELWKEFAENLPQDRANDYYSKIISCRKASVSSLSVLENAHYCKMCSVFDVLEWHYLKMGFWDLYSVYLYTNKDYGKAYNLANVMADSQDFNMNFSDAAKNLVSDIKEELNHFKQGMFGGWKYVE